MSDFGTMVSRIEDEIARTDLTTNVERAIVSAINYYEREPWWFLEDRTDTFTTSSGAEFYSSADQTWIATAGHINTLKITVNSNRYDLVPRQYEYLDSISLLATSLGQPQDFCYYAKQFRLYPIPDAAYEVRASYNKRTTTLSAGSDSSDWMTEAEELIRSRAKWDVYAHVIRDMEGAEYMKASERDIYGQMKSDNIGRVGAGITPTFF